VTSRGRSSARAIVVLAACAAIGLSLSAQAPRIQTIGTFRWDTTNGSVLLQQVAEDRLLVQLRILTASHTSAGRFQSRSVPTDKMEAWVLLDDGKALEQTPRQPPSGAPAPGFGNAGDVSSFVTFGFKLPPRAAIAVVVTRVEEQYYAFPPRPLAGADLLNPAAPAISPPPIIVQPELIRWPLSDGIQALTLMNQSTFLKVDLAGESVPEFRGEKPVAPSPKGLQVWVLSRDGTVVAQRSPMREGAWASMGGWATRTQELTFAHARFKDLAAVIVSVGGRPTVRELPR
jgi:hypothetical protein